MLKTYYDTIFFLKIKSSYSYLLRGYWSKQLIAICALACISFMSCKPESKPKEEQHLGPFYFGKYTDYFWFKPGTYWIYENNRTGELDTCILTSIERDTVTMFYEHPMFKRWFTYEKINYVIYTRHRFGYVSYSTASGCIDCPTMDTSRVIQRDFSRGIFKFPWKQDMPYSDYFPSMQVNGITYYDVYRFDQELDEGLPNWDESKLVWGIINGTAPYSSYYWARGVGLIQIKYKTNLKNGMDSAFWNLKTSQIVKY